MHLIRNYLYLPSTPDLSRNMLTDALIPNYMHMKLYPITLAALVIFFSACETRKQVSEETSEAESEKASVSLRLKWETDTLLTTCESVLHDEDQDVLYVSNINGGPDNKDGNGFISKVSMDGKVTEQFWVKGIDAPKGMGLSKGKLYVTDINRVHEIDTKSGKITRTHTVAGATFLNDIAVDNDKIYISDSNVGSIYVLQNGNVSAWKDGLQGPNGLFAENGKLLVGLWGTKSLNTVDLSSKDVTVQTDSLENADGIEGIGNNEFLVSSWNGMVHHVDSDWKKTLILDTRQDSISAADIEYVKSKKLLLVPTFFKNKVMAYELVD